MNRLLHYTLSEPFVWLYHSIVRPVTFAREVEIRGNRLSDIRQRALVMLRLALPLFLLTYLCTLIIRLILERWFPQLLAPCYLIIAQCVPHPNLITLIVIAATNAALGVAIGSLLGMFGGIVFGVTIGIALGIALGIANALAEGVTIAITLGLMEGMILGTGENFIILFLAWGLALGLVFGFTSTITLGIGGGIAGVVALSVARGITGNANNSTWPRFIAGVITGSVGGVVIWHITGEVTWSTTGEISQFVTESFLSLYAASVFFICYILGYYRIPLYLINSLSMYQAYRASNRTPDTVFTELHHSALYWDEYLFLPLPYLKPILLLAARQDQYIEQVLKITEFIAVKQPRQITAARRAVLELLLRDLEKRQTLSEIVELSEQLANYLLIDAKPIDPEWLATFERLQDACRDAARYCSLLPLSHIARYRSLENMLANLEKIYPDTVSQDVTITRRLQAIVQQWKTMATQERRLCVEQLEASGPILNPYTAGPALELHDRLFVGRRDLVRKLEEALSRENRRPTFFLYGERRMGKSSTLKQLPDLLGPRYIPVTYDLQRTGVCSSVATFLSTIAEGIYEAMNSRRIQVPRHDAERWQEVSKENEAMTYWYCDRWLKEIEFLLEQEQCMLLLAFDEFEQLEAAQEYGHLNVSLLLAWLRSILQNRPRLALLFSGIRTVGEMQENWTSYFVNTQTHKVSFLAPKEARNLVTPPIDGFPGDEIFGEDVIEEILRVTGGHPFLIQAICEKLIDQLNDTNRNEASIRDVVQAIDIVMETWDNYFQDLWRRTDQEQQQCLLALYDQSESDMDMIIQHSHLDKKTVHRTLQALQKRDLIASKMVGNQKHYAIATPIFYEWVKRNSDTQ